MRSTLERKKPRKLQDKKESCARPYLRSVPLLQIPINTNVIHSINGISPSALDQPKIYSDTRTQGPGPSLHMTCSKKNPDKLGVVANSQGKNN